MDIVNSFITKRAESTELPEQLHAIWCGGSGFTPSRENTHRINGRYCLPTDTDRPQLEADKKFFDDYGSGRGQ